MPLRDTFRLDIRREASKNPFVKGSPQGGLITNWLLFLSKVKIGADTDASEAQVDKSKVDPSNQINPSRQDSLPKQEDSKADQEDPAPSAGEDEIGQLVAQNSDMSAATFYNLLKSKGFCLDKHDKTEADSSSSNAAALRSGIKKEASPFSMEKKGVRFLESAASNDAIGWTRARCVLIQEGLGNFGNAAYYSREAIQSAVHLFEGKKIYADHPGADEEQNRPERSVRDVLGHYENVQAVEAKSGRYELQGDVCVLPDDQYRWARGMVRNAVAYAKKYPDKEFVGLSINATGTADPMDIEEAIKRAPEAAQAKLIEARDQHGITQVQYVSKFDDAISCDLVTEAGAGGKILNLVEGAQ